LRSNATDAHALLTRNGGRVTKIRAAVIRNHEPNVNKYLHATKKHELVTKKQELIKKKHEPPVKEDKTRTKEDEPRARKWADVTT
jgi:hypothetical protein